MLSFSLTHCQVMSTNSNLWQRNSDYLRLDQVQGNLRLRDRFLFIFIVDKLILSSRSQKSSSKSKRQGKIVRSHTGTSFIAQLIKMKKTRAQRENSYLEEKEKRPQESTQNQYSYSVCKIMKFSLFSLFDALLLGSVSNSVDLLVSLLAILPHKFIESYALAYKIHKQQSNLRKVLKLILFGAISLLALGTGRALAEVKLIAIAIQALASGCFTYLAAGLIVVKDFSHDKESKTMRRNFMILGGGVCIIIIAKIVLSRIEKSFYD